MSRAPEKLDGGAEVLLYMTGPIQQDSLELFALTTGLLGGLALFLFGMDQMAGALKKAAGSRMRAILARLTANRFAGVATGAFVTAVIQSSSVTTVLVVGFITAGLLSMSQSIGIIMGANIGTTVTAQIIAFKVTKLALVLVAGGFGMSFLGSREKLKVYGAGVMGIGLIFLGMSIMGEAMYPLRTYQPFIDWMSHMERPILGILAGALFTALVQSSSATTGVVIAMASQGLITLPAGIALIFGSNIGTCVTALLASAGKPREAVRAAAVHVTFNVAGVLLWLGFIDYLAAFVTAVSPASSLSGADLLAATVPRQIANAHTVFNVANTLVFIWFAPLLARLVERMVPDRPLKEAEIVRAKYLDSQLLSTPSLALDRARLELLHMSDSVREMLKDILPAMTEGPRELLDSVQSTDDRVDVLHGKVVTYLGQISGTAMTERETEELLQLLEAANALENIGDIIETNLVNLGRQRMSHDVEISDSTLNVIREFHTAVSRALDAAMQAVTQRSGEAARVVSGMKNEINALAASANEHQAQRLTASEPNRLPAYTIETDIVQNLKRIYYFCKRMARTAVTVKGGEGIKE